MIRVLLWKFYAYLKMANMSTHRTFTWIVVGSLFLSSRPQVCKDLDSSLPTACEIAWYIGVTAVVREFWQQNSFTASIHSTSKCIMFKILTDWLCHFLAATTIILFCPCPHQCLFRPRKIRRSICALQCIEILESLDASAYYWLRWLQITRWLTLIFNKSPKMITIIIILKYLKIITWVPACATISRPPRYRVGAQATAQLCCQGHPISSMAFGAMEL